MSNSFARLSQLFRYPQGTIDCSDIEVHDAARGEIDAFAREVSSLDRNELESAYTSTFDLAPSCSPYLGAHLFGEDDRDRGRLLAGLRMTYERTGLPFDEHELPDHIAEVLAFAEHEDAEEWPELVKLILVPALTKMDEALRSSSNPYRHLIAAARQAHEVLFVYVGEHPYGRQIGNGEQLAVRFHHLARGDVELGHDAVDRSAQGAVRGGAVA